MDLPPPLHRLIQRSLIFKGEDFSDAKVRVLIPCHEPAIKPIKNKGNPKAHAKRHFTTAYIPEGQGRPATLEAAYPR
eukprot:scaffold214973_cov19-Tisochrysis_lutea.AAC.2